MGLRIEFKIQKAIVTGSHFFLYIDGNIMVNLVCPRFSIRLNDPNINKKTISLTSSPLIKLHQTKQRHQYTDIVIMSMFPKYRWLCCIPSRVAARRLPVWTKALRMPSRISMRRFIDITATPTPCPLLPLAMLPQPPTKQLDRALISVAPSLISLITLLRFFCLLWRCI